MNEHNENYGVGRRSDDPPRQPRQRQRWARVGIVTGLLWAVPLIVDVLSSGTLTLPWFVLIPGFVVLWLVGRRAHLHGPIWWFLAGALAVVVVMLILPLVGIIAAIALYG